MFDEKECCGNCRFHKHEQIGDGWVCVNDESEYLSDFTDYNFCCDEWEERQ